MARINIHSSTRCNLAVAGKVDDYLLKILTKIQYLWIVDMQQRILVDIEIDKLTNSIENRISGDIFDTEIFRLDGKDIKQIITTDWLFNWHEQIKFSDRETYKLTIKGNSKIIQGLVSLSDRGDHIYMHLIESSKFNKGKNKIYIGVPGNLVAFACKLSFEKGYEGYLAFDAKTVLIKHYQETLYATHFKGTKMLIETPASIRLIDQYFKK